MENRSTHYGDVQKWIEKVMTSHNFSYEVLFIDDLALPEINEKLPAIVLLDLRQVN